MNATKVMGNHGKRLTSIDKGQTIGGEVEVAVVVVVGEIGGGRNGVVDSVWEGPGAPLLTAIEQ